MPHSSFESSKIRKFGTTAKKALRKRLDPTSEASIRIAEASDPPMSPMPEASGISTPISGSDIENSNGKNSRDDNSDKEQNAREKAMLIKKKLT